MAIGDKEGSLIRHSCSPTSPQRLPASRSPATLAQVQAALDALGAQHVALAQRLFAVEGESIVEDAMVTAYLNHHPTAALLVWCAS